MKLYRDLNSREQRQSDRRHRELLEDIKQDAELRMELWDSLTAAQRAEIRAEHELHFHF